MLQRRTWAPGGRAGCAAAQRPGVWGWQGWAQRNPAPAPRCATWALATLMEQLTESRRAPLTLQRPDQQSLTIKALDHGDTGRHSRLQRTLTSPSPPDRPREAPQRNQSTAGECQQGLPRACPRQNLKALPRTHHDIVSTRSAAVSAQPRKTPRARCLELPAGPGHARGHLPSPGPVTWAGDTGEAAPRGGQAGAAAGPAAVAALGATAAAGRASLRPRSRQAKRCWWSCEPAQGSTKL